jgi:hypothetical protein
MVHSSFYSKESLYLVFLFYSKMEDISSQKNILFEWLNFLHTGKNTKLQNYQLSKYQINKISNNK